MGISNSDDLWDWFKSLEEINDYQRQIVYNDKLAEMGCELVAFRLFLKESEKPSDEQRWDNVLTDLNELADKASNIKLRLLWACSISAQIAVLTEYCDDFDTAIALAETAMSQDTDDPRIQFVIKSRIGRQYFKNKNNDKAVEWLEKALCEKTDSYPTEHLRSILNLSAAIGQNDSQLAINYAKEAVSLAEIREEISELDLIKSLGELAIALWLNGNLPAVFGPWEKAGDAFLIVRKTRMIGRICL